MPIRIAFTLMFGATSLLLVAGCQSTQQCCTGWFAGRAASVADTTELPERVSPIRPTSLTDETTIHRTDETLDDHPPVRKRFKIPEDLPGADAAPLTLPPMDATESAADRRSIVESLFPEVMAAADVAPYTVDATALPLASLQQMALDNSPIVRQAAANVEQARGAAVQARLYPNPVIGYEGDTIGTAATDGYNGVFMTQEFVTAGKLTLAQNSAMYTMRAAEADLRKARIRLASNVRRNYFNVLIAQERLRFSKSIAKLSNEVYQAQVELVAGGEAAAHEPLQLRVFAVQARNNVILATNGLDASWRQLAAAIGLPRMESQPVAGSVEALSPDIEYRTLVERLQHHTDLMAAQARIVAARFDLQLQEVTPIPNIQVYAAFQKDDTTPLNDYSTNVQISAPVPVLNRNQGNIATAHATLVRAQQDFTDANNGLMSSLADNFARYASNRTISESYRTDLLPDQVRVYRGVYNRFLLDGQSIDFAQVVVVQQTLATVVTSYLQSLTDSWNATVDLAELVQINDLMTMDGLANDVNDVNDVNDEPQ